VPAFYLPLGTGEKLIPGGEPGPGRLDIDFEIAPVADRPETGDPDLDRILIDPRGRQGNLSPETDSPGPLH